MANTTGVGTSRGSVSKTLTRSRLYPATAVVGGDTTVAVTAGSVTWSGQSATTKLTVSVTTASVTFIGQTVTPTISVPVTTGSSSWTGRTVTTALSVPVAAGSATFTGQTVTVSIATVVPVTAGSVTFTGQAVALKFTYAVAAGSASWTGQTVSVNRTIPVTAGSTTFTGQTVTVTFPPIPTSGLVYWFDFSDATKLYEDTSRTDAVDVDGDLIKGVTDLSGAGNHLSEATNPPVYKVGIINSLSVARFAGTNTVLSATSVADATTRTIFVLATLTTPADNNYFIDHGAPVGNIQVLATPDNSHVMAYSGTVLNHSITADAMLQPHVVSAVHNGASSKAGFDNTYTSGNAGTSHAAGLTVGQYAGLTNTADIAGDIGEIIGYDRALSTGELDAVWAYLETKWFAASTTVTVTAGSVTFTGQSVGVSISTSVTTGSVTWTGQAVALKFTTAVIGSSVTWSGQSVTPTRVTPVSAGSATWTGQAVAANQSVPVTAGSVTWNGQSVTVTAGGNVTVGVTAASVTFTGQSVGITLGVPVSAGSATWQGQSVALTRTTSVTAGSVSWTGQSVTVSTTSGTTVAVTAGAVTWQGQSVALKFTYAVTPGSVTWAGQPVTPTRVITVGAASVTWQGQQVGVKFIHLITPGAVEWQGQAVGVTLPGFGVAVPGPTRKRVLVGAAISSSLLDDPPRAVGANGHSDTEELVGAPKAVLIGSGKNSTQEV